MPFLETENQNDKVTVQPTCDEVTDNENGSVRTLYDQQEQDANHQWVGVREDNTELVDNLVDTTDRCSINDTQTPVLILFGPSQCGKSMTMVRLANYFVSQGLTVEPRRDFRPSNDLAYQQRCDQLPSTLATYSPLPGNAWEDYMLATVSDSKGNSLLQILEGPGEAYFSLRTTNPVQAAFPAYLNVIKNSNMPKIWCFFIEPDWAAGQNAHYVERIKKTRNFINLKKDRIIFLYNKVDKTNFFDFQKINTKALVKFADSQYPGLFEAFRNKRLGAGFLSPEYLCELVPFSTGDYSDGAFVPSNDSYPALLVKKLKIRVH